MDSNSTQVLIVGAGPTGLVMALELARNNVPCRLIEKLATPSDKSRAIGIQARTLELFERIGIVDQFVNRGIPIRCLNIHASGKRIAQLRFTGLESPYPYLLSLQQTETEQILTRRLEKLGVKIERSVELTAFTQDANGVTATLKHADRAEPEQLRVPWLIGCDGAHSVVRTQLKLPFVGETSPLKFILADFRITGPLPTNEASGFTSSDGAAFLLPLPDGYFRLIATNPPPGIEGDHLPTLEDCQAILNRRGPGSLRIRDPIWLANFRVNSRLASGMRQDRIFLMGDASHIHSPAGAQGMNTGIQDAVNLAWKLALVVHGAAAPSLLDSYEAERYPVGQGVLRMTDFALSIGTARNLFLRFVRNCIAPLMLRFEFVQSRIRRRISQIAIHYRCSAMVEDHLHSSGPSAGDRAPDGNAAFLPVGATASLYHAMTGTPHWLLLFSGNNPTPEIIEQLDTVRRRLEKHNRWISTLPILARSDDASPFASIPAFLDRDQNLHRLYHIGAPALVLIRPDGYIAFRSPADDNGDKLVAYLGKLFC